MSKVKTLWSCKECGHTQAKWAGCCTVCGSWNSFSEEKDLVEEGRFSQEKKLQKPIRLSEVNWEEKGRLSSAFSGFDRVMGGGTTRGSLTLIAGAPGIGKSTLMLQLAESFAKKEKTVLYISGEESCEQTALRAKRLDVSHEAIFLFSETLFSSVQTQIEKLKPDVVIIDSVQIMYKKEIPSTPGSVSQVREITLEFMMMAKSYNIAIFLVGHVTKSGEIAGPRVLEHMVDTVLDFEGDRNFGFRLLRSVKNRFGSTSEVVIFQMKEKGLVELDQISNLFLEEREEKKIGSVISSSVEGGKPFLLEIQALVTPTSYPAPSRRGAGIDPNRLALILAVIEKKIRYKMHMCDVFVSLAGGMKIIEPSIDLAIFLALVSSFSNRELTGKTLVLGELGLSGEIRRVSQVEARVKEAIHMGFERVVLPKKNKEEVKGFAKSIQIIPVQWVEDAAKLL